MEVWLPGYLSSVSTNKRLMHATPDQVWDVLSNGWFYPMWVVGRATVTLRVSPVTDIEVSIEEQATADPGALVPRLVQDPVLAWRRLRRLASLIERRQQGVA